MKIIHFYSRNHLPRRRRAWYHAAMATYRMRGEERMKSDVRQTTGRQGVWTVVLTEHDRGAELSITDRRRALRVVLPIGRGTADDLLSALIMLSDQRELDSA